MDITYTWLNRQIDNLKDDLSPERPTPDHASQRESTSADLVVMSARLNALRPGVAAPDAGFISGLRKCVIAVAQEASDSQSEHRPRPH